MKVLAAFGVVYASCVGSGAFALAAVALSLPVGIAGVIGVTAGAGAALWAIRDIDALARAETSPFVAAVENAIAVSTRRQKLTAPPAEITPLSTALAPRR